LLSGSAFSHLEESIFSFNGSQTLRKELRLGGKRLNRAFQLLYVPACPQQT
jgi:hypothetical protein